MLIKTKNYRYEPVTMSLAAYVDMELDADCDGQLENVKGTVNNATQAFGRLIEALVDKGVLTLEEALNVAVGYVGDVERVDFGDE